MLHRFVLVWLAQCGSVIGTAVSGYSITVWLAADRFPNASQHAELAASLAALNCISVCCTLTFLPIAGVITDSMNRFIVMTASNICNFVICMLISLFFCIDGYSIYLLFILYALLYSSASFHTSSFDVAYFMLVSKKHYGRASALLQLANYARDVVAPPTALLLIGYTWNIRPVQCLFSDCSKRVSGYGVVSSIDAITYLCAASVIFLCQVKYKSTPHHRGIINGLFHGVEFIRSNALTIRLLTSFAIANLAAGAASVLELLAIKTSSGASFAGNLAVFAISGAVGGIVSILLITICGSSRKNAFNVILVAMATTGLAYTAFVCNTMYVYCAANFVTSFSVPIMNTNSQSLWLSIVPIEEQGRVFAARRIIAQSSIPVGSAIGGFAGAYGSINFALPITGIFLFLASVSQLFLFQRENVSRAADFR